MVTEFAEAQGLWGGHTDTAPNGLCGKSVIMFQLIYTSTPSSALTFSRAEDIAARASIKNRVSGVTGILLMSSSVVLQVLEGDETTVRGLYELIKKSKSHMDCDVLLTRHCDARSFPKWSMGYRTVDDEYEIKLAIVALKARRSKLESAEKIAV